MATEEFTHCIQRLFKEIGFRHEPFPAYEAQYWEPFHHWMLEVLGPTSSWNAKQLAELEHASGGVIERSYPCASTQLKLLFAKLTAIAIIIDDSIEDEAVHQHLVQFSDRLYRGETQQNGLLALYHENMKELSAMYGQDSVLRGLATVPWINYIDACLMEKQLFNMERGRSQDQDVTLTRRTQEESLSSKFPHYLRSKSGIAEAYAAGVFKADKEQYLPLTKYIKVIPDLTFYIEVINDVLSFYKEEIAGETYNLIHLRTRSISSSGKRLGTGVDGTWTPYDTLRMLCDELGEATRRIDGLLRLEECERKLRGELGLSDIDEIDVAIAMQWRGWRDGYISWHLECRRYKLEFLKAIVTVGH
ncbi:terpenoid synthase [Favolaschia claudopus]|uniref:Terpenoid synthase n=1 Tax=Favolaschia claudopus TaxID=2862362 RepID=A0AAV9ZVV3_9AGAR